MVGVAPPPHLVDIYATSLSLPGPLRLHSGLPHFTPILLQLSYRPSTDTALVTLATTLLLPPRPPHQYCTLATALLPLLHFSYHPSASTTLLRTPWQQIHPHHPAAVCLHSLPLFYSLPTVFLPPCCISSSTISTNTTSA